MKCSVDGCEARSFGRGLCAAHYARVRRFGSVRAEQATHKQRKQWLLDHMGWDDEIECLIWPHSRNGNGYGPSRKMTEMVHGPAPSRTHQAAHSCGKGRLGCVNPNHLRWATPAENANDRREHGTLLEGEKAPWHRLTEESVEKIRLALASSNEFGIQRRLAKRFGVTEQTISDIKRGRRWRHLANARRSA